MIIKNIYNNNVGPITILYIIDTLMDMICMIVTWIHNKSYFDLTQPSRLPTSTTFESIHDLAQPFGGKV